MIGDRRRREKSRKLEPAVAVRRAHHGHLDAHGMQPGDALCPVSFDRGLPFKLKAELTKELNRRSEVLDDNAYIVHPLKCHVATLLGRRRPVPPLRPPWA